MVFSVFLWITMSCYVANSSISDESKSAYYLVLAAIVLLTVVFNFVLG